MEVTQFRPGPHRAPTIERSPTIPVTNGLDEFNSEHDPLPRPPAGPEWTPEKDDLGRVASPAFKIALATLVGVCLGTFGTLTWTRFAAEQGSLRIETSKPGVDVLISGKTVGRTPVSMVLPPGSYPVKLAGAGGERDFTVDLTRGATVVRHVDMPEVPPPTATTGSALGSLLIQTEPSRLPVLVDGVEKGKSPLSVTDVSPGEHQIAVRGEKTTVRRSLTVKANENTVLMISAGVERPAAAAPAASASSAAAGWLTVQSAVELSILEAGRVIGTTQADRVMMPAGDHKIELSNESLGFVVRRAVLIESGKTAAIKIEAPTGMLNINAQPWAEVWVDGQRVGETPIGNLVRPIGRHQVVLRHPEFGERRETVTVTLRQPARLGVDMRKK